jgi:hypothetical protein
MKKIGSKKSRDTVPLKGLQIIAPIHSAVS